MTELAQINRRIQELAQSGVIARGSGYCISMSDMIYQILTRDGFDCELIECKLTVMSKDPPMLNMIGHDQRQDSDSILDTHVCCMVKLDQPVIIDLSIGHLHPAVPWICEPVQGSDQAIIAEFDFGHSRWIYMEKGQTRIPLIQNKQIVNRIKNEQSIKAELRWLKIAILVLGTVVLLNAVRGAYDFYQVYVVEDNNWGPIKHSR